MEGSRAPGDKVDARGMRIAIAVARFNAEVVEGLLEGAQAELTGSGADVSSVRFVPGAWELPLAVPSCW